MIGVGFTWLGAAWVHDPELRQEREAEYQQRWAAMTQADAARHKLELNQLTGWLWLGGHAERLLWAIHRAVLAHGTSLLHLPDTFLAGAVWGRPSWPRHWRGDLLRVLGTLTWLHAAPWLDGGLPAFGPGTALLTRAADLRSTEEDVCAADCTVQHGPPHHHVQIEVGPGFLGLLEKFAKPDGNAGLRRYSFPSGRRRKADGPTLRSVGKTGKLVEVYVPALLGELDRVGRLSLRQRRLVQAVCREATRAPRQKRTDVSEIEVFAGNDVPDFSGQRSTACPLLDAAGRHVCFGGNGVRRGCGYRVSAWLAKAGYKPSDLEGFLADLNALARPLGLTVAALSRSAEWSDLQRLRKLVLTPRGRRVLERLHVRVYAPHDFVARWNQFFGWVGMEQAPLDVESSKTATDLAAALSSKNLSLRQLATGLGKHHSFVVRLMNEDKPWPEGLLAKALAWVDAQHGSPVRVPVCSGGRTSTDNSDVLATALRYLRRGWCVIPQWPRAKHPCVKWKPFQERRPSARELRDWYAEWPDVGVALVLGPVSRVFVVDVDGPEAHVVLVERLGGEPRAPKAISGSHKPFRYHLFFRHPPGLLSKAKVTPWHPSARNSPRSGREPHPVRTEHTADGPRPAAGRTAGRSRR